MNEEKELAKFIFENRSNKQLNNLGWALEEIDEEINVDYDKWNYKIHKIYLNKARDLLSIVDFETAKRIIRSNIFIIE